jgi:predicted HTH transcriptional regulator
VTETELRELVALGEARGVELKGPLSLRDRARDRVIRAAMALANRRDGGYIVVGVSESKGQPPEFSGLDDEQARSWNYDDLADELDLYATPRIRFSVQEVRVESKQVVVIRVAEFDDVPVLCKRDSPATQAGACYVYPLEKAEARPIPTEQDMRDLLDRAAERQLRRLLARVGRAGGRIVPAESADPYRESIQGFFDGR